MTKLKKLKNEKKKFVLQILNQTLMLIFSACNLLFGNPCTVISQLSSQIESEQFVRTYMVGANITIRPVVLSLFDLVAYQRPIKK